MTDPEYVLCLWKKRLWPAKVLCKTGVAGETSATDAKGTSFGVEILGLKEQVSVSCADAVPLTEERVESIAGGLDQKNDLSEAVEELKYRCSLKIALDILTQNGSAGQVPPSEEGPVAPLSRERSAGSLSSTPLRRCRSVFRSEEKLELETSKKKRKQKNNPSLKTGKEKRKQKGSVTLEESTAACGSGASPAKRGTGDLGNASGSDKIPKVKSLPSQKKIEPKLVPKSKRGNKASLKPKGEQSKQGRKRPRGAGSPVSHRKGFPKGPAQPLPGEGSPQPDPCKSDAGWGPAARGQPGKAFLDSSGGSAGGAERLNQVGGRQEIGTTVSSRSKRSRGPGSSPGRSDAGRLSGGFPSPGEEEENGTVPRAAADEGQPFQLSEEDEGRELPDLSSETVPSQNLPGLSALADDEEEDEELPSILSLQEPPQIEEGILVWCKLRKYPYWPAVVKTVKRKHRKACVLLIEENMNYKKKGFSVSLKNLKHFDCEERQELIEQAKKDYRKEVEWCIRLISDYRIRVGCRSFTGSFLEYFAADISYPVRKESYQSFTPMTFPVEAEEDVEGSSSETSPQKPSKKLLPDRTRAARDRANKKIVEFIVKAKGAEEHLLAILKSRKQSRWLKEFLNSNQCVTCIETYLEDEDQLDLVVNYLKDVYCEIDAESLRQIGGDGIKLISDVLLPEAIIYAISAVDDIDYKKAEEKFIKGPSVSKREREIFDEEILERKKRKAEPAPSDSS
ncbi:PWWP domain-containing DNA repair factor 3A [Leptosomus discolor]